MEEQYFKEARKNHLEFIFGLVIMIISYPLAALVETLKVLYIGTLIGVIIVIYSSYIYTKNIDKWPKDLVGLEKQ